MDKDELLLVSGTGEVIEPDDGILAIGSGGHYALAAGRALKKYSGDSLTAEKLLRPHWKQLPKFASLQMTKIIVEVL